MGCGASSAQVAPEPIPVPVKAIPVPAKGSNDGGASNNSKLEGGEFWTEKNTHFTSSTSALGQLPIRVYCGTWNMHGTSYDGPLHAWIPVGPYDVYAIGTQEAERSIKKSFWRQSKVNWEAALRAHFGSEYRLLRAHTLMAIHLAVFVRKSMIDHISLLDSCAVPTGLFSGRVGNKGGVGISFCFGSRSFLFLNCHLTAHHEKVTERNEDYYDVVSQMELCTHELRSRDNEAEVAHSPVLGKVIVEDVEHARDKIARRSRSMLHEDGGRDSSTSVIEEAEGEMIVAQSPGAESSAMYRDITDEYDDVFFMGDLNYRINGLRNMLDLLIARHEEFYHVMIANDQLTIERENGRTLRGFKEPVLTFLPTYKFDPGTNKYDTSEKRRIPAWTDRVLYKSQHWRDQAGAGTGTSTLEKECPVRKDTATRIAFGSPEKKIDRSAEKAPLQDDIVHEIDEPKSLLVAAGVSSKSELVEQSTVQRVDLNESTLTIAAVDCSDVSKEDVEQALASSSNAKGAKMVPAENVEKQVGGVEETSVSHPVDYGLREEDEHTPHRQEALDSGSSFAITPLEYDSVPAIKSSDHKPVFATFEVQVEKWSTHAHDELLRSRVAPVKMDTVKTECTVM